MRRIWIVTICLMFATAEAATKPTSVRIPAAEKQEEKAEDQDGAEDDQEAEQSEVSERPVRPRGAFGRQGRHALGPLSAISGQSVVLAQGVVLQSGNRKPALDLSGQPGAIFFRGRRSPVRGRGGHRARRAFGRGQRTGQVP